MESHPARDPNLSQYLLSYRPLPHFSLPSQDTQCDCGCLSECKAMGIPICETESEEAEEEAVAKYLELPIVKKAKLFECPELASIETEELSEEETIEESPPSTLNEDQQTDDIQDEVERIRLRVSQLDYLLDFQIPECPEMDSCLDMDVELKKYITNPEILELQRNNHKLKQQISQLELSCRASDLSLNKLKNMVTTDREDARKLQKGLNELDSFKRIVEREHLLCAQRYRQLEQDKYDGIELHPYFKSAQLKVENVLSKSFTKVEYQSQKRFETKRIQHLNAKCKKLYDYMFESLDKLTSRIGLDGRMQSPELTTFLYRNEKMFGGQ